MVREAIEYTTEPITIGNPTDVCGMKVTVLPMGFTHHYSNQKNEWPNQKKGREKIDWSFCDSIKDLPEYANSKGTPNWKKLSKATGIRYETVYYHYCKPRSGKAGKLSW